MRLVPLLFGSLGLALGCGADECQPDESSCSADALELTTCVEGKKSTVSCMADHGQLCEAGRCVDPWRYGAPVWSTCADEPRATPESLAEKAAYYDDIAARLHVHPRLRWAQGVVLKAGAVEATATWQDVERWMSGENDGLWSALYLASQAFRYAATQDPSALEMLKVLLAGEVDRVRVTGVPGMFTRQFIPPGVDGIACPADDASYTVDQQKDDNRWVQIREDGCAWVVDRLSNQWTKTEHCGQDDFAGYCWLDNVSKDEYSGHMFALGVVYALVPDEAVQATVRVLLSEIGTHLVANRLAVRDWDGRTPEHGRFHPQALDNFPGFNAAMSLGYLQTVLAATKDAALQSTYDECLLMSGGPKDCFETGFIEILPFRDYLEDPGLYIGNDACRTNYNNVSMHVLSMHNLVALARDPERRSFYQLSLDRHVMNDPAESRTAIGHHNAFFDFVWAANKAVGPGTDGPAYAAVEDAVCMLKQFPSSKAVVDVPVGPELMVPACKNRFDEDTGSIAREVADRCIANFVWWRDPYDLGPCTARPGVVEVPTDYLLAYWMGRYYGFVPPEL